MEPGRYEERAVARDGQARALIVAGGQARDGEQLPRVRQPEHLAERVEQQQRAVGPRRHGHESRQRLARRRDPPAREERRHEVEAARERGTVAEGYPEDQRPLVAGAEHVEPRRRWNLGPALRLGTRVVDGDQPAVAVERDAAAAHEVLQPDGDRGQPAVSLEVIDAIAVLLAEVEVARTRIDRQAPERRLARRLGEGDDDARRAPGVDRQRLRHVQAMDLARRVAATAVAQHDEAPTAIESELDRPAHVGDDHLRDEAWRCLDARGRARARGETGRHRDQRRRERRAEP